jgi:NAD-dependent histone deacetylase SIR2
VSPQLIIRNKYASIDRIASIPQDDFIAFLLWTPAIMEYGSDSALSSPPSSPLSLPSSPLSIRSKSPTPPCDYPSPSSTLLSGSRSPSKALDSSLGVADPDGAPPKKKRKLTEQKSRTTEYLDLRTIDEISQYQNSPNDEIQLQRLLKALRNKQKIVVIAGAGISVSAGSKI